MIPFFPSTVKHFFNFFDGVGYLWLQFNALENTSNQKPCFVVTPGNGTSPSLQSMACCDDELSRAL